MEEIKSLHSSTTQGEALIFCLFKHLSILLQAWKSLPLLVCNLSFYVRAT